MRPLSPSYWPGPFIHKSETSYHCGVNDRLKCLQFIRLVIIVFFIVVIISKGQKLCVLMAQTWWASRSSSSSSPPSSSTAAAKVKSCVYGWAQTWWPARRVGRVRENIRLCNASHHRHLHHHRRRQCLWKLSRSIYHHNDQSCSNQHQVDTYQHHTIWPPFSLTPLDQYSRTLPIFISRSWIMPDLWPQPPLPLLSDLIVKLHQIL